MKRYLRAKKEKPFKIRKVGNSTTHHYWECSTKEQKEISVSVMNKINPPVNHRRNSPPGSQLHGSGAKKSVGIVDSFIKELFGGCLKKSSLPSQF